MSKPYSKKIHKGDRVLVIAGNERGRTGEVLSVHGEKAVVQGLNLYKKHVKPSMQQKGGGIVELERAIHISNLIVCDPEGRPVKLKVHVTPEGDRQLVYANEQKELVVHRTLKKNSR